MEFLEVKGKTRTFTAPMDIRSAEKRLDALTVEDRSLTKVRTRIDVKLDRRSHDSTNFWIDKNVSDYWYIVAAGVLEQRESDKTTVTFHTRLSQKGMLSLVALFIAGIVLLILGTSYALILPLGAIGGFVWSHFIEGNALAKLVEEALS